jgi:hypothetical protein
MTSLLVAEKLLKGAAMDHSELRRALMTRMASPKYQAGKCMGWGRVLTDKAEEAGQLPIIPGPKKTVATSWLKQQLGIVEEA